MNESPIHNKAKYISRRYPEQWKKYEVQLQQQENVDAVVSAVEAGNEALVDTLWKLFDTQQELQRSKEREAEPSREQTVSDKVDQIQKEIREEIREENAQEALLSEVQMTNLLLLLSLKDKAPWIIKGLNKTDIYEKITNYIDSKLNKEK